LIEAIDIKIFIPWSIKCNTVNMSRRSTTILFSIFLLATIEYVYQVKAVIQ